MNLSGSFTVALAALALPAAAAAQAAAASSGEVMFVSGQAERLQRDGAANPVAKGMALLEGDRIRTAADSHVYVRLRDGGLLVVRPASELHVDLWRYDPAQPQESRIKYTLDNGVARHVSGQGAKSAREKFRFNTPMAAIGVRGTDFTVLANTSVTRVSVQSGGVVVNGFGNGCRADGLGPCEGTTAVELYASAKDKLLQVRAGERRPEIIEDPAAAPDRARPPVQGEPVAQKSASTPGVELAESRGSEIVEVNAPAPAPNTPPPPASEPPAAPPPASAPPQLPVGEWGRWAAVAGSPAKVDVNELLNGRTVVAFNKLFVLAANPSTTVLPGDGVGNFKLAAHEGFITDKKAGTSVASTASDGKLSIDFGTRRFDTSMTVAAGDLSTQISSKGTVEASGRFQSDAFTFTGNVSGIVGGKGASEAMYLYQRSFGGQFEAIGATTWGK